MPYIGKKPADIIATAVDTTTGTFSGDLTVDTNTLYVDSANNRVGIGTSSPSQQLEITTASSALIRVNGSTASVAGIDFGDSVDQDIGRIRYDNSVDVMQFWANNAERMRIDSSGNLLVGTTGTLSMGSSTTAGFQVGGDFRGVRTDGNPIMYLKQQGNDGTFINFYKDTSSAGSIQASGTNLVVGNNGNVCLNFVDGSPDRIQPANTNRTSRDNAIDLGTSGARFKDLYLSGSAQLANITNGAGEKLILNSDNMVFQVQASERMRIDSSGNLLVGKTSASNALAGTTIQSDGKAYFTRDGGSTLDINRLSSDGDIAVFRKDTTTVGSIGTFGSALYISSPDGTDAGLRVGNSTVVPVTTTGALRDNAIDLGSASARWKNLYLSGGVTTGTVSNFVSATGTNVVAKSTNGNGGYLNYSGLSSGGTTTFSVTHNGNVYASDGINLGGTGSANKLDDYEEGTFNFSMNPDGGSYSYTYGNTGYYTKVGNIVSVHMWIHLTASGVTGNVNLSGLPFTVSSSVVRQRIPLIGYNLSSATNKSIFAGMFTAGAATMGFGFTDNNMSGFVGASSGNFGTSAEIYVHGEYLTNT